MKELDLRNYRRMVLFSYSTVHLLKKDKIRFYYALKGRDGRSGMVKFTNTKCFGRACLLVKDKYENEIGDFLNYWSCKFIAKGVFVRK